MSAPKPANFDAMSRAWNDPTAYAAELARYYAQLTDTGHAPHPRDLTVPTKEGTL
ncbi:hypothetical protein [Microbacterium sp. C7(2022)]|uniref:hypothetical protein n=1 Tax=Microbacterium sp. C7(2022) TaxID=2992759 RepID=UPI00237ABD04|nr:hypothetical protein [Microbacterium sp. C7(2022)]MDE0545442.1 hypothetical protein [Microbacterium sp. C7(2022)]